MINKHTVLEYHCYRHIRFVNTRAVPPTIRFGITCEFFLHCLSFLMCLRWYLPAHLRSLALSAFGDDGEARVFLVSVLALQRG